MNAYDLLLQRSREVAAYQSTASILSWDQETYMPVKAGAYRAEQLAQLAGLAHRLGTAAEVGDWIAQCEAKLPPCADEEENSARAANVREWRRDYNRATRLPARLVEELARTTSLSREAWIEARRDSNFAGFAPWLEKILTLTREQAEGWGYDTCAYDALLEGYEPGARVAELNPLFADLQKELTPLIPRLQKITASADPARLERDYPIVAQQRFNQRVAEAMGFDFEAGRIDTTTHPFCTELGPRDCRLTTRYHERDFTGSLFGVMHEAGHGLYTQGLPPEHFGTPLGTYLSLGIHESQSRLWENQVGRSREFWKHWYSRAVEEFPVLRDLPPEEFWVLVNRVQPSHIRVEADEATYNLHIILRYEIEQKLVSGELPVEDLPRAWNSRFEELFQIPVPDDARGCLQDTHWSLGLFGYFPTYTLGTLAAAQLFRAARKEISTEETARGELFRTVGLAAGENSSPWAAVFFRRIDPARHGRAVARRPFSRLPQGEVQLLALAALNELDMLSAMDFSTRRFREDDAPEEKEKKDKSGSKSKLEEKILETRTILLFGEISQKSAREVCEKLILLSSLNNDDIKLIINSQGGHVEAGDTIHDIIRFVKPKVKILGTGWVASAGALIYVSVPTEQRYSLPNTRFMLHQPSGGVGGQATDISIEAAEILKMRVRLNHIFSVQTGQSVEKIERDTDRNFWMSAEEAKQYGLVGKVISTQADF